LQGKAPKEIYAILTETLACFLPVRAKDFSAPLQGNNYKHQDDTNFEVKNNECKVGGATTRILGYRKLNTTTTMTTTTTTTTNTNTVTDT